MKKIVSLFLSLFLTSLVVSQNDNSAHSLLDSVSEKMGAYKNMFLGFSQHIK